MKQCVKRIQCNTWHNITSTQVSCCCSYVIVQTLKFLNDRLIIHISHLQRCKESKTIGLYFVFQVGIAACQIARAYGLKVLGTAGTEEGQNIVLQNEAHEVFNHREVNYIDKIKVKLFYNFMNVCFYFMGDLHVLF